jgi:hypothetical protein
MTHPGPPAARLPAFDRNDHPRRMPPGHWAGGRAAYLAEGLDRMASEMGLPDGQALVEKATGHTAEEVRTVSDAEFRAWFETCYYFTGGRERRAGDVVMYGSVGIFSSDAGWTAPMSHS